MTVRKYHDVARLIHQATWGVTKVLYSTNRGSDWRSKDARRAVEYILTKYDIRKKPSRTLSE